VTAELLPRVCVFGPTTRSLVLRLGKAVRAVGVVIPATFAKLGLGVTAEDLVDRVVSLEELWVPTSRIGWSIPSTGVTLPRV
jgi:hypothetical protein